MSALLYRPDMDQVRQRLTTWWQGGELGRPAMALTAPRDTPLEPVEALPEPPGWGRAVEIGNLFRKFGI